MQVSSSRSWEHEKVHQDTAACCEVRPEGTDDDASIYDVWYSESALAVKADGGELLPNTERDGVQHERYLESMKALSRPQASPSSEVGPWWPKKLGALLGVPRLLISAVSTALYRVSFVEARSQPTLSRAGSDHILPCLLTGPQLSICQSPYIEWSFISHLHLGLLLVLLAAH